MTDINLISLDRHIHYTTSIEEKSKIIDLFNSFDCNQQKTVLELMQIAGYTAIANCEESYSSSQLSYMISEERW